MDFLVLALLAGLGVSLICAPLGAFIVWQRMAYFGDSLAHSALLGVAFGLLLQLYLPMAIFLFCALVALLLLGLTRQPLLPTDTLIGIVSHTALAFGLIMVSMFDANLNLERYLLGDILSSSQLDLVLIGAVVIIVVGVVWRYWQDLLLLTINQDMAEVEGVPVKQRQALLMVLYALVIAVAINIVGVLLITALLIIPAAVARFFSSTPERMVIITGLVGCLAVCLGLAASWHWDTPAGPSIVASTSVMFILVFLRRYFAKP